jgi:hypothetical protein
MEYTPATHSAKLKKRGQIRVLYDLNTHRMNDMAEKKEMRGQQEVPKNPN